MQIIDHVPNQINAQYLREQYAVNLYAVSSVLLDSVKSHTIPGKIVCLFSGAERVPGADVYIEPAMFKDSRQDWPGQTIFVDPSRTDLLNLTLTRSKIDNLLIINSVWFSQYQHWTVIKNRVLEFQSYARKLIVTIPLDRFDWNRLRYSTAQIAATMGAEIIENSLLICR